MYPAGRLSVCSGYACRFFTLPVSGFGCAAWLFSELHNQYACHSADARHDARDQGISSIL
jgi:hypothetical protein|tara:strand:+ start:1909 stop:2088 length:180 start_codon:yes stop_codon:yes gene_type:complete